MAGQLLGWLRLCGRGLASCLDGMAGFSQLLGWLRLCGRAVAWVVQAVWPGSSELLGWYSQGLVSCLGVVAWFMYCIEWK